VLANLFAVVFPWVAAIPFMSGGALNDLITWSSLAFGSVANFIIPFIIYIKACNFRLNERERLTQEQHEILVSMGTPAQPAPDAESGRASRRSINAGASSYQRIIPNDPSPFGGTSSFKSINAGASSFKSINAGASSFKSINATSSSFNNLHITSSPDGASTRTSIIIGDGSVKIIPAYSPSVSSAKDLGTNSRRGTISLAYDPDAIPTPLPPNFVAIPYTTPQSARWIARFSLGIMVILIIGVIVLAIVFP